jgi:uncharacterized protein
MQQIISIHGGTTFYKYDDYLHFLKTKPVRLARMTGQKVWKDTLQQDLGSGYQVLAPTMPNSTNAKYTEWALWFDRIAEVAENDCILIGHSLGGIFLAKYLSEHTFPKKIKATILIAAPFEDESGEDLTDFKITGTLDGFVKQAGDIIFYHGTDDIVPLSELELYKKAIPTTETHVSAASDHFMREAFPELIERIKKLA